MILMACSTEKTNFGQLQERSGLLYIINKDKPFTGDAVSYLNGRVEFEGHVDRGMREGAWLYYYPNGQKKMEGNFKEGVKDGTWTYWKDNGQQEALEMYKYGKLLSNEGTPSSASADTAKQPAAATTTTAQPAKPAVQASKKVESRQEPLAWERLRGGAVKFYEGVPYTGPVVKYQKNGLKEFEGNMFRGKKSGSWNLYDKKGNIKSTKYY